MANLGKGALGKRVYARATVAVPEWGGDVLVRELTAAEVASVQALATSAVDPIKRTVTDPAALARFQAMLIVCGWIDDDGANVLGAEDIESVLAESASVVTRVANEIGKLSGLQATVEEVKKN